MVDTVCFNTATSCSHFYLILFCCKLEATERSCIWAFFQCTLRSHLHLVNAHWGRTWWNGTLPSNSVLEWPRYCRLYYIVGPLQGTGCRCLWMRKLRQGRIVSCKFGVESILWFPSWHNESCGLMVGMHPMLQYLFFSPTYGKQGSCGLNLKRLITKGWVCFSVCICNHARDGSSIFSLHYKWKVIFPETVDFILLLSMSSDVLVIVWEGT